VNMNVTAMQTTE